MSTTTARRSTPPDDGLTLVEMVVAIGILMTVLIASLSVFITVQRAQQVAEGTDRATQLANSRLERIRQLGWTGVGFYDDTYTIEETKAPADYPSYTSHLPPGEPSVRLGPTDPLGQTAATFADRIKPYEQTQVAESRNIFHVYTTITWYTDPVRGLPAESGTTTAADEYYSFKRVRITVRWRDNNNGAHHHVVNETWFAPHTSDEAPPTVPVVDE